MAQFKLTLLITKLFAPPRGSKTGYMSRNSTCVQQRSFMNRSSPKRGEQIACCHMWSTMNHFWQHSLYYGTWYLKLQNLRSSSIILHVNSQHFCQTHMYASSDFVIKPSHLHYFCVYTGNTKISQCYLLSSLSLCTCSPATHIPKFPAQVHLQNCVYAHIQQASSTPIITSRKFSIDQEVMAMVLMSLQR